MVGQAVRLYFNPYESTDRSSIEIAIVPEGKRFVAENGTPGPSIVIDLASPAINLRNVSDHPLLFGLEGLSNSNLEIIGCPGWRLCRVMGGVVMGLFVSNNSYAFRVYV